MSVTKEEMEKAVQTILSGMGENAQRHGLVDTPRRVADYFLSFSPKKDIPAFTTFPANTDGLVCVKNMDLRSMCIPGYQRVNTRKGSIKASAIKVGDELWTLYNGIPALTTVTFVGSHKSERVVKVTFENGKSINLTTDHPLKTKAGWVEAGSSINESVEYCNPKTYCKTQFKFKMGYSLGYALAVIMAECSIQDNRRISLETENSDVAIKYTAALLEAFGIIVTPQQIYKPSGYTGKIVPQKRVRFVSSQVTKRVIKQLGLPTDLGSTSKTFKFLFPELLKHDFETFKGFLDGYVDTDGTHYKGKREYKRLFSSNTLFLNELATFVETTYAKNGEGSYSMNLRPELFKPEWFSKHGFSQNGLSVDLGESEFVRVVAIEKVPDCKVYSFKCSEHSTFCVEGFLTHNCEHHLCPFIGKVHVGYYPGTVMAGLSKFQRVVDYIATRPQNQERIGTKLYEYLKYELGTPDIIVVIEAEHTCMTVRGVRAHDSKTHTINTGGKFDYVARQSLFLSLIK